MKTLLLYPHFPKTFWSYDEFMKIAGLKAFIPPLGIITVAALLPENWEIRFYDRNVNEESDEDWEWCDLVILSAMVAQKQDFLAQIASEDEESNEETNTDNNEGSGGLLMSRD